MKSVKQNKLALLSFLFLLLKYSNSVFLRSPYEQIGKFSTPVSRPDTRIMTTPEYVHPYQTQRSMRTAQIITGPDSKKPENIIHNRGMIENPNYMSTVISFHPTSIFTNVHSHIPNSPTFDLMTIKSKRVQEATNKVVFNINQKDDIQHLIKQFPPGQQNQLNSPPKGPATLDHKLSTVNKYKMSLLYHGQSNTSPLQTSASAIKSLDEKVKKMEKLDKDEMKDLFNSMKDSKVLLEKENGQLFSVMGKSENQINLILNSLDEDISDTQKALDSMLIPIPENVEPKVFQEISDEYTKALEGFVVDKTKYPHLRNLDSKEVLTLSEAIKKKLGANKNFFLHGDDFNLN